VAGQWRLFGINLSTQPAQAAAPAPSDKAAKAPKKK
jgi:hypothetical protein